jgi:hypothetical protein
MRTLEEMRRLAFADIRQRFDASGHLKPIHTLTADEACAVHKVGSRSGVPARATQHRTTSPYSRALRQTRGPAESCGRLSAWR